MILTIFYFTQSLVRRAVVAVFGLNEKTDETSTLATIALVILAFLLALGFAMEKCSDYRETKTEQKIEQQHAAQSDINANISVLGQQQANANVLINKSNANVQAANKATREAFNRDSSSYSGANSDDRWCEWFYDDSSCSEYRKTHERKVK